MLRWDKEIAWMVGIATLLCASAASAGRPAGKPATLWLWYPEEGNTANTEIGPYCSAMRPTPYQCTFGPTVDDCKRQVQAYLDVWYADFNLVITFDRPKTTDYYLIVVTNDGSWCPHDQTEGEVAGLAYQSPTCEDVTGFAGYALECGYSAHDCATVIAHEHGHMVGLEHTDSIMDIMNRRVQPTAKGFEDFDNSVYPPEDFCELGTQNSYQRMLAALGPWPGGAKPSPSPSALDAGVADARPATFDTQSSGSIGPITGSTIDGGAIVVVPGYDALTRPPLPTLDASGMPRGSSHGGCSFIGRPLATPNRAMVLLALFGLLVAWFTRNRRARRGQPATERLPCAVPARSTSASRAHDRR